MFQFNANSLSVDPANLVSAGWQLAKILRECCVKLAANVVHKSITLSSHALVD